MSLLISNLREAIDLSRHCTSPEGGRIPTFAIKEAIERIEFLEAELRHIAKQVPAKDMDEDYYEAADFEHGYDSLIFAARKALGLTS